MAESTPAQQLAQYRRESAGKLYQANRGRHLPILKEMTAKYGVDPYIAEAIVYKESRFNPNAYNPNDPNGARGLPQFIASTGKAYGLNKETAFDPRLSLDAQARFLRDRFKAAKGDPIKALRGYNRAQNYAESVVAIADELRNGGSTAQGDAPSPPQPKVSKPTADTAPSMYEQLLKAFNLSSADGAQPIPRTSQQVQAASIPDFYATPATTTISTTPVREAAYQPYGLPPATAEIDWNPINWNPINWNSGTLASQT